MTRLVFLDTETTGLDPDLHEVWEVACIVRELPDAEGKADGKDEGEYVWQLPVDLGRADPFALNVGRFHERRWEGGGDGDAWSGRAEGLHEAGARDLHERVVAPGRLGSWARMFAELTWGAHLVGAVVSFDEERLRRLLRAHGACPGWHYHLIDVENLAAGYIRGAADEQGEADDEWATRWYAAAETAGRLPWSSEDLSKGIGVEPDQFDRHTALGDARWAAKIYDAVMHASA